MLIACRCPSADDAHRLRRSRGGQHRGLWGERSKRRECWAAAVGGCTLESSRQGYLADKCVVLVQLAATPGLAAQPPCIAPWLHRHALALQRGRDASHITMKVIASVEKCEGEEAVHPLKCCRSVGRPKSGCLPPGELHSPGHCYSILMANGMTKQP
eukprot:scaffold57400_cov58-Phaeocystis_antarctica.AAC.1